MAKPLKKTVHRPKKQNQKPSLKHWYGSKRHLFGWVAFFVMAIVVGLQLAYPMDRALPNAKLGNRNVTYWTYGELATKAQTNFIEAEVTLRVAADKSVTYSLGDIGAQPNVEYIRTELTDYPLWQRLIPFSSLAIRPQANDTEVFFATDKLEQFARSKAAEFSVPAKNAGLKIEDGVLVASEDVPGSMVDSDKLAKAIIGTRYSDKTTIKVPTKPVFADKPAKYFESVKSEAVQVLTQDIVILIDDEHVKPERSDMAKWLEIAESEDGSAVLGVAQKPLRDYVLQLQKSTRVDPGKTDIKLVNSREVSRSEGKRGKEIDAMKLQKELTQAVLDPQNDSLSAVFVTLKPQAIINNTYTSSQDGLQAFVSDETNNNSVQIAVEQLNGSRWKAAGEADKSVVSASTYKLFVALRVLDDIGSGKRNWNDSMLDTDVRGCMERMIVVSLNTCAENWLGQYGNTGINQYIYSKGFSKGTDFNNPTANHTTANDLKNYMKRLQNGTLMNTSNRDYMIKALGSHGYTKGIPAGSKGEVHNKVGFLWSYSNDSAIVYHPKGTYVVAVMTNGKSFYAIADIIREMEVIMYP